MSEEGQQAKEIDRALSALHEACGKSLAACLGGDHAARIAKSYSFLNDLELWKTELADRPEAALLDTALSEYAMAHLALVQAQYRNAFKSLRLVFELVLQTTFASTNLLELREWLTGARHTSWSRIVEKENGLFSKRVCRAFYEELSDEAGQFRTISETVYTELSECIHGNVARLIPLPNSIEYKADVVAVWLDKCETIQTVAQFALSLRYLRELGSDQRSRLEQSILDQLGHLGTIRANFGGVVGA